jgi:hypothetical protein
VNEYGKLVEEVVTILGPVKRRTVREEWHNRNLEPTAVVPLSSCLTLSGSPGRRVLCDLGVLPGKVETRPKGWE